MHPMATAHVSAFAISSPTVMSKAAVGALSVTLQRNFSQIIRSMSANDLTLKPASRHAGLDALDALGEAAVHLADADEAHPVVVHVAGFRDRRSEAFGDADHDVLVRGPDGRRARPRRGRSGTPSPRRRGAAAARSSPPPPRPPTPSSRSTHRSHGPASSGDCPVWSVSTVNDAARAGHPAARCGRSRRCGPARCRWPTPRCPARPSRPGIHRPHGPRADDGDLHGAKLVALRCAGTWTMTAAHASAACLRGGDLAGCGVEPVGGERRRDRSGSARPDHGECPSLVRGGRGGPVRLERSRVGAGEALQRRRAVDGDGDRPICARVDHA